MKTSIPEGNGARLSPYCSPFPISSSGSFDYKVKLWDFAAMDARMRSFREVQPYEGVQVYVNCPAVPAGREYYLRAFDF